jgi:DNA primase
MNADRIPHILAAVDLEAEVSRRARPAGRPGLFYCPGHDDQRPSFTVKKGRFDCYPCAQHGDIIDLLVWLDGITKAEAIERLAEQCGIVAAPQRHNRPTPPTDAEILAAFLESRGWGWALAAELDLRVVSDKRGQARVRFPFRHRGKTVYHADRATVPGALKWLNATGAVPCPYEVDRLEKAQESGAVVLVEGITDTAAIVNAYADPAVVGIPGVGGLKDSWAPAFADLSVYVIADRDEAGERLRSAADTILGPVAAGVAHIRVPEPYGDVAEWIAGDGPDAFDSVLGAVA